MGKEPSRKLSMSHTIQGDSLKEPVFARKTWELESLMTVSLQLQAEPWICHMIAKLLSLWFELKIHPPPWARVVNTQSPACGTILKGMNEAFRRQSLADRNRSLGANSEDNLLALAYLGLFLVGHLMKKFLPQVLPSTKSSVSSSCDGLKP